MKVRGIEDRVFVPIPLTHIPRTIPAGLCLQLPLQNLTRNVERWPCACQGAMI